MTVGAVPRRAGPTPGNGVATVFPFAFKTFLATDLLIELLTIASGVKVALVLNDPAGYTVALNADQNANPGGSITYNPAGVPLPATQSLTITSAMPESQGTHLINGGNFLANNVEDMADRDMMATQDLAVRVQSSLQIPAVDGALTTTLPPAAQRANLVVGCDANGNFIMTAGGSNVPIAAAWQAVVQAATLAAGRAAMGFSAFFDSLIAVANAAALRALALIDGTSRVLKAGDMADSMMGFSFVNGTLVPSQNGTVLTVAIKTKAGADPSAADPVYVLFRNAAAGTGDYTVITLTAATSIATTVGGTFGVANNVAFKLWVAGFNDGGVFRLALINCLTTVAGAGVGRDATAIYPLGQFPLASATQIGAGSTSAGVFYSAGAAVVSKAYSVLGYLAYEAGLAAAGTFGVNQTRTHLQNRNDPLPGTVIQIQRSDTGAVGTGTTVTPFDDTIPQSGEGDQYMAAPAITPSSASNVLRPRFESFLTFSVGGNFVTSAIYQDATANALAAIVSYASSGTVGVPHCLEKSILAGGSVATTFKMRGGGAVAGTTTFNGQAAGRIFGGVMNSFIEAQELLA